MTRRPCEKCSHLNDLYKPDRRNASTTRVSCEMSNITVASDLNNRYQCNSDKDITIEKDCDQYFPKNVTVLLVCATKDQSPLVSQQYEKEIGSMKRLNEFSFIAKNGDLYVATWAEEANLRGRKAYEVWVDGQVPFGQLIFAICSVVDNDIRRVRTF